LRTTGTRGGRNRIRQEERFPKSLKWRPDPEQKHKNFKIGQT
jgi:hypothetical protein